MMTLPSKDASQSEQAVDAETVESLKCTPIARRAVSDLLGIVMDSEQVTKHNEFGYIYRYKYVVPVERAGKTYYPSGRFVLCSKDCKTFKGISYSDFELPNPGKDK